MGFHRLTVPGYFGGIGANDYLNNAVTGTPAAAGGPKADGPNAGSYFVGFAEDGVSSAWNRGLKALGQNTDQLDDWFHRDLADPQVVTGTTGAVTTSIVLTGPAFVGVPGTPNSVLGISTFVTLVDAYDNEIYNAGVLCQVSAISGATPGDVFSTGNITLTITPGIPASTSYRIYYSMRTNLTAETVDMPLKNRRTYHKYKGGPNWADATTNPPTTIPAQLDKIVTDLSSVAGAVKIGNAAYAGSPFALSTGSVYTHIGQLLGFSNTEYAARVAADATINSTINNTILPRARNLPALNVIAYYNSSAVSFRTAVYNTYYKCWHILGYGIRAQRSYDYGLTWNSPEAGSDTVDFASADVNPTNGDLVVGATGNKIYKCAGGSWTNISLSTQITEWFIAFDPVSNLFSAFASNLGVLRIYTSPDGTTWTVRTMAAGINTSYNDLVDIKYGGGRLLAVAAHNSGTIIRFAYSTTGGTTWTDLSSVPVVAYPTYINLTYDPFTSTWIFVAAKVSATRYCRVWTSIDNGATWTLVSATNTVFTRIAPLDGIWLATAIDYTLNTVELAASYNSGVSWYTTGFCVNDISFGTYASSVSTAGALILGEAKAWVTARYGSHTSAFPQLT